MNGPHDSDSKSKLESESESPSTSNPRSNERPDCGEPRTDATRHARSEALLCDVMCGSLARYLRMCGYDAAYALDRDAEADDRVLAVAREEGRTVLTRDRQLAARARAAAGADGLLLDSHDVRDQLRELAAAGYELALAERPVRCGRCNGRVEPIAEDTKPPEYVPDPAERAVWRCGECGQYFWKGSHWDSVERTLAQLW